jgi:hypothetical protein
MLQSHPQNNQIFNNESFTTFTSTSKSKPPSHEILHGKWSDPIFGERTQCSYFYFLQRGCGGSLSAFADVDNLFDDMFSDATKNNASNTTYVFLTSYPLYCESYLEYSF